MASRSVSKGLPLLSVLGVNSALDRADSLFGVVQTGVTWGNAAFSGTVRAGTEGFVPTSGFSSGVVMFLKSSGDWCRFVVDAKEISCRTEKWVKNRSNFLLGRPTATMSQLDGNKRSGMRPGIGDVLQLHPWNTNGSRGATAPLKLRKAQHYIPD